MVRLWGIAAAALIFVGPASAFSVCTGVRVDLTKAGPAPLTQIATFGDVVDWALTAPYPTTKIAFRDGSCTVSFNAWAEVGGLALSGCWPSAPGTYAYSVQGLWDGSGTLVVRPPPLQVLPSPVVYGDSAVLAGEVPTQIECNGGPFGWVTPVIEVEALLLQESYGESALAPFATATATGARGDFAMLVSPKIETTYQARLGNLLTVTATIQVRPRLDLSWTGRHRLTVHATAARSLAGARVQVQLERRTVRTLELDASGSAGFTLRRHGRARVFMPAAQAGPGYVAGFSNPISL